MMRTHLHKIKVEDSLNKFYHYREKCYKVWKMRVSKKNRVISESSNPF